MYGYPLNPVTDVEQLVLWLFVISLAECAIKNTYTGTHKMNAVGDLP